MVKNRWISDLHWVREGQQTRSQKTQQALLDAAEELFSEQGIKATSVADVARRAGCSVGAVYHHFRDKKALLYALVERMTEEMRETTKLAVDPKRWEGATVLDIVRGYLEFSLNAGRQRPGFKHAALELSRDDPEVRDHLIQLKADTSRGVARLLLERRAEIGHPAPETAVAFVIDQLSSMLKMRLDPVLMHTTLNDHSDEDFVEECLRSVTSYLQLASELTADTRKPAPTRRPGRHRTVARAATN